MADHDVELVDDQILLRAYRMSDAQPIYQAVRASLAEMLPWFPWCHADYALAEMADFIARRDEAFNKDGEYSFVVTRRESGEILGGCGLNRVDREMLSANLGYWIRTDATGQGYATRAARMVARFALETLDFERVQIAVDVENRASQRVAEKTGATRECVARRRLLVRGQQHDAIIYSLVRTDARALADGRPWIARLG